MFLLFSLIAFFALLGVTAVLAAIRGDRYDRAGAAAFVLAALISFYTAELFPVFLMPNDPLALIDLTLLIVLLIITAKSSRYWPIWSTGFQLVTVLTHLATMVQPDLVPRAYAIATGLWSFPTALALTISLLSRGRVTAPAR